MQTVLLEETVVVVHLKLAFNLAHGVECNTDHDENRGTTKRLNELVAAEVEDDRRDDRDAGDEDTARRLPLVRRLSR